VGKVRSYFYNTYRKEDNTVDSILMVVIVETEDSLKHITFTEQHLKNGNEDTSFVYTVNKYGIIDWAYRTNPPTSEPTVETINDSLLVTPSNQPIFEINTDSANYIPKFQPIKIPDEKTKAFYNAKLITSLDELDKMLFAK
jgi:hypothetical protein